MANRIPVVVEAGQAEQLQEDDNLYVQLDHTGVVPRLVFRVDDNAILESFSIKVSANATQPNLFFGVDTGIGITTGVGNLGIGYQAGQDISTGDGNFCVGNNAGSSITIGDNNFCFGNTAGTSITSGIQNICIGSAAGDAITTTNSNVAIGNAAYGTGTGANNFSLGTNAGFSLTTPNNNIFIGSNAGNNASQLATAANCVSLGGSSFTGGSRSIAIGVGANTTGADSIVIGDSQTAAATDTVIGHAATTMTFLVGGLTVNDGGIDQDHRFEGDTLTHFLFMDSSAATENIAFVTTAAPNWQTMDRGLFVGDITAAPTGNPTAGFFFYSNAGVPTFRTSGGSIINLNTSPAYTPTNVTTDRSYDANATTVDELADVLGTVIADLQARGLLG